MGALCTIISFVVFVLAANAFNYLVAGVLSWIAGIGVGFALNRRLTFGISGSGALRRHVTLFVAGSLAQFALALSVYWLLIGKLHLTPAAAFCINLLVNAGVMFAYLSLVVFRRSSASSLGRRLGPSRSSAM
ncbi:MAG: GtrA family protein [Caulobacteraceae bacterium]